MDKGIQPEEVQEIGVITDVGVFMEPSESSLVQSDTVITLQLGKENIPNNAKVEKGIVKIEGVEEDIELELRRGAVVGSQGYDCVNIEFDLKDVEEIMESENISDSSVSHCPYCGDEVDNGEQKSHDCRNCGSTFTVR